MQDLKFIKKSKALRLNIGKRNQKNHISQNSSYTKAATNHDSRLVINGGTPLKGVIPISGAKNAALPLMFASLLSSDIVTLSNVPDLADTRTTLHLLEGFGAKVSFNNNKLIINPTTVNKLQANSEAVSSIRASTLALGPLLTKYGSVELAMPGGCTIGSRPIDIHLEILTALGAELASSQEHSIKLSAPNGLKGTDIYIKKASVGATQNALMAAVLARGTTRLTGAAKEPEVLDLINMLNSMGAEIRIESSSISTQPKGSQPTEEHIVIEGVKTLRSANYCVCPDRIEAGSYLIAAAASGGDVTLTGVNPLDLYNIIEPLKEIGCIVQVEGHTVRLTCKNSKELISKSVSTGPYPLFATDLQPQWTALMCLTSGNCTIRENIFENRFGYTKELQKMGACINLSNPHECLVSGVDTLKGAEVFPLDLRASFAMIVAALATPGETIIHNLKYLDRGYENLYEKLSACGANIKRY